MDYIVADLTLSIKDITKYPSLRLITEGKVWEKDGFRFRLDPPHYEGQQKHLHISYKRHPDTEVVWAMDGTLSHAGRSDDSMRSNKSVRAAAAEALGIDAALLEVAYNFVETGAGKLLLENCTSTGLTKFWGVISV